MKKLLTILISIILTSCATNTTIVNMETKKEIKYKLTPTMKYFNKRLNSKRYGLG
jgi:hypothetical protein